MKKQTKNSSILKHILKYCTEIDATIERFGDNETVFKDDFVYQNACSMSLLQIGELTKHLTPAFKETFTEIPWKDIYGMRHFFAHDYGNMNTHAIWMTLKENIPNLEHFCKEQLGRYDLLDAPSMKVKEDDSDYY